MGETYKLHALVQGDVEIEDDEDLEDFKMLLSEGDPARIAAELDEYDNPLEVNLTDEQVIGWQLRDSDGKIVASGGEQVPLAAIIV